MIQGSKDWTDAKPSSYAPVRGVDVEDVHAEARRRLKALKIDEWKMREFVTGVSIPDDIRHVALQIEFASQAISRLSPIPSDYADDIYWPRVW
ncbi:hypothetical protein VW35_14780 [Devosia soli]|uniref:Uncharacterized protein n=1 Tax=Devosia soli TaxID=361041 RepID=A0A0F5L515_9HYPH|nr:hypothetical protein VW35_14780 [Devosia soli]